MISLLKNHISETDVLIKVVEDNAEAVDEAHLIQLIYRFAGKKDEWFNLLLSLSNFMSLVATLPESHAYQRAGERLLNHIQNAIKISGRINTGSYTLLNNNILEQLPIPAGIVDAKGRIVDINQDALSIIEQLPKWSVTDHHLCIEHIDLVESINNLVQSKNCFLSLPLQRSDSLKKGDYKAHKNDFTDLNRLYLSQIPNPEHTDKPYIYFCFNSRKARLFDTQSLKSEYALTETEALVVTTLIEEPSSSQIAKRLKLKDATIRGHLTNIYSKLGVNRKPELIRKLMLRSFNQATTSDRHFDASFIENNALNRCKKNATSSTGIFSNTPSANLSNKLLNNFSTKHLVLKDGRHLSYLDINHHINDAPPEANNTFLILHNMMGSAFELPPSVFSFLKEKKLRVLIPERPGYGDSCRHENRNHESFCHDIKELLDNLDIKSVNLIAHSIGSAYALSMAEFIPERIVRIAMVNAIPRKQDMVQSKATPVLVSAIHKSLRFAPFLIEPILTMAVGKDIDHFYAQQLNYIRPTSEGRSADIHLLSQPEYRYYSLKNLKQSAKQGIKTWSEELKLSFSHWPFKVTNNKIAYQFWHGEEDDIVPISAALHLAKQLNTECFYQLKHETHYLFSRHIQDVIQGLISPINQNPDPRFEKMSIDN